jgi:hypothetical protein
MDFSLHFEKSHLMLVDPSVILTEKTIVFYYF